MTPNHTSSRRRVVYGLLPPLVALAACTALPQAALIYSSRVSGGLDISGGATDTQGVSLNIGFKTTDLAYVPVAVAASAPGSSPSQLTPLTASHGEGISNPSIDKLSEENRERLAAYVDAAMALAKARNDLRSVEGDLIKAEKAEKATAAVTGTEPERLAAEKAKAEANQKRALVAAKQATLAEAQKVADAKMLEADESIRMLQSQSIDAMSVYGQFNGTGGGSTPAASSPASGQLAMGRVFSTGVAAQNLTQAAQQEARSLCITRFKELVAQVPAASQAEVAIKVTDVCPGNTSAR
ncbi:MAG: hypothetical protein IV094_18410 [Vitreoscilla sp.]|nr:hypothetical protein [Vitreoscilla sp.]